MITVLRRVAVVVACVLLSGLSVPLAYASDDRVPVPPPGGPRPSSTTTYDMSDSEFALTISPTRLVLGPDELDDVSKFLVVNRGRAPVSVTVEKRNFVALADGSLKYQDDAPYGAASWVTVTPASFEVAPGSSQTVSASVTVPPNPELGDHQVALVFLVPSGQTEANIKINRGIGVPTYITVPGPTDDTVALGELAAPGFALGGPRLSAPGFSLGGPVDISTTVRNVGTVHRDFRATNPLTVDGAGSKASFPDFTVPRGSARDISTTWDPPLMCICHPTVGVPGPDGTIQQATARVIVFPLHLLGLGLAVLALIFFVIRWRRHRYAAAVRDAAERMQHRYERVDS